MARCTDQKLKILYLEKIFREQTDEKNHLTMPQILHQLSQYGIEADRKTIYKDMKVLEKYGFDIVRLRVGARTYYYLGDRLHEAEGIREIGEKVEEMNNKMTELEEYLRRIEGTVDRLGEGKFNYSDNDKNISNDHDNIKYMTISEVATKWELSVRRVQLMCAEGRIKGDVRFGNMWMIPKGAERPKDRRVKTGKYRDRSNIL